MDEIEPLPRACQELAGLMRLVGRDRSVDAWLGTMDPGFVLLQALLRFADRRQQDIETLTVGGSDSIGERSCLGAEIVQNASAVAQLPEFACHLFRRPLDE